MAARRGKPIGYRTSNECNRLLVGMIRPQTVTGPLGSLWTALLAARNVVPPRASAPVRVAWWMARCVEAVWRVFRFGGEPPITRQMLRMIGRSFTLNISRARSELGYQPIVSWQSGIAAMQ